MGKTTLIRALGEHDIRILPDIDARLSKIGKLPYLIANALFFLPTYVFHYRRSRWFTRRESRSMAYLRAGLRLLRDQVPNGNSLTVLDHGPIYRLSFLREFGPAITESDRYKDWWRNLLDRWINTIDLIVWLDAPNDVLIERVRHRDRKHTIKGKRSEEAIEFLSRYRMSFERTIAEGLSGDHPALLQFDTNQDSISTIADTVLAAIDRGMVLGSTA